MPIFRTKSNVKSKKNGTFQLIWAIFLDFWQIFPIFSIFSVHFQHLTLKYTIPDFVVASVETSPNYSVLLAIVRMSFVGEAENNRN